MFNKKISAERIFYYEKLNYVKRSFLELFRGTALRKSCSVDNIWHPHSPHPPPPPVFFWGGDKNF